MINTLEALGVAVLALLPGALYTWSFEREVGAWGATFADRLFRFVGASAVFHAAMAWPSHLIYSNFVHSGRIARGEALPAWMWFVPVGFVIVPILLGSFVGNSTYRRRRWTRFLVGRSPAPRAWDHLFAAPDLTGWVIVHRKGDKSALAGTWAASHDGRRRSYAAGYPETQDLFLIDTVECDPGTGQILIDTEGAVQFRGISVLIRWDEIEYLEFIEG